MSCERKLQNFEEMFDPAILARGRDYFRQGCVLEIEEIERGEYRATVEGSELYEVCVSLDEEHSILDLDCDCPYDWDAHCKHKAAVLFALRQQLSGGDSATAPEQLPLLDELREVLSRKTKDALLDILVSLARDNPDIGKRVLRQLKVASPQTLSEDMWAAVHRACGGNIKLVFAAMTEVEECIGALLDAAREAEQPAQAATLCMDVLAASEAIADSGHDEYGELYETASEAVEVIKELVEDCAEGGTDADKAALFSTVLGGIKGVASRTWDDALAECLLPLCSVAGCRQQMDAYLENRASQYKERNETYSETKIRKLQLDLIRKHDGGKAAARFIQQNLQYDDFRVMAIDAAMQRRDYPAALALAQEAIPKEGYGGTSRQWQRHAFDAYKAMGELTKARDLARQFVLSGSLEYYEWLKQSAAEGEWESEVQGLLAEMESRRYLGITYERVLIAEALWERLMAYAEHNHARIFELHEHLSGRFAARVQEVFRQSILTIASKSTNRAEYRELCSRIRTYGEVCGQAVAEAMVRVLCETYRRRPAMREELDKAFAG